MVYNTQKLLHTMRTLYLVIMMLSGIIGICFNVTQTENGTGVFLYYTIQSNIICILAGIFYIYQIHAVKKIESSTMALVQGGVVMCIMLTFLVFHFLLLPTIEPGSDLLGPGNTFIHYVLPLMVLGDYIFFQKKGNLKGAYIFSWTVVPLLYCLFVFVYSALGGRFGSEDHLVPYFFLNYKLFGVGGVALWILALASAYMLLSLLFVCIDSLLEKVKCLKK